MEEKGECHEKKAILWKDLEKVFNKLFFDISPNQHHVNCEMDSILGEKNLKLTKN